MRYLVLVAMIFALSGCTALVVGGAATAAYQVGKDEREPEVIASDSAITTKIKSKYAVDSVVSVFGIGRTLGWTAHAIEQAKYGRLMRPRSRYIGPRDEAA